MRYVPKFSNHEQSQTVIENWFDQATKNQLMYNALLEDNKQLRAKLLETPYLVHPKFLIDMMTHAHNNSSRTKNNFRYSERMKEIALYIFTLAGPLAYTTLQLNLTGVLPSLSSVKNSLSKHESVKEGTFRFNEIKERIIQRGENLFVHISEDDTKLSERLRYDSKTDQVLGLQLPLNDDGVPQVGVFKFTTLTEIQRLVNKHPMSTYAKVMNVRTLGEKSSNYTLVVFGTNGSDTANNVHARWEFVRRSFEAIDITVVGKILWIKYRINMTKLIIFRLQC